MHARRFRQQAGFACETCRKRKARCDRVRPRCSLCAEMGVPCVVVDKRPPQRGPKKGQLEEMRARIAQLEWQLGKQPENVMPAELAFKIADAPCGTGSSSGSTTPPIVPPALLDEHRGHAYQHLQPVTPSSSTAAPRMFPAAVTAMPALSLTEHGGGIPALLDWQDIDMFGDGMLPDIPDILQFNPEPAGPIRIIGGLEITNLILADLDQLYFDRVHTVLPMIHLRRYFSWADQEKPTLAQSCLQSAMHTVAAAMSAQYQSLCDALYQETCQLLESQRPPKLSGSGSAGASWLARTTNSNKSRPEDIGNKIPIELIQAWILLAHYEFLRVDEHQAMVTAGRAFRLVQLARLYDIDGNSSSNSSAPPFKGHLPKLDDEQAEEDFAFIIAEEKRRTFWLAFSFDRFLCSHNEWPLTLHEETVQTQLPVSEASFQNNQPTSGCFLSKALAMSSGAHHDAPTRGPPHLSPFAECIVLAALLGRCMTHRRMALLNTHETQAQEFWIQHEQLASAIEERTQMLIQSPELDLPSRDSMVLFTHMLAQKVVIYLSGTLELVSRQQQQQQQQQQQTADGSRQPLASSYKWRAERAAAEMVRLAESVKLLECFDLHPFMADHLACAAEFLLRHSLLPTNDATNAKGGRSVSYEGVESLLSVLRNLCYVNIHAQDLLCALEAGYGTQCIS